MLKPVWNVPGESLGLAGYHHICFNVHDVDAAVAELRRRGVHIVTEPFKLPVVGRKLAFFADPRSATYSSWPKSLPEPTYVKEVRMKKIFLVVGSSLVFFTPTQSVSLERLIGLCCPAQHDQLDTRFTV